MVETIKCKQCQEEKPKTLEYFCRTGTKYLSKTCRKCYPSGAARRKERKQRGVGNKPSDSNTFQKNKNRAKIQSIKIERGCIDCGFNRHPAALDFDHLPGSSKVNNISNMLTCSWESIIKEIDKCEVVCANCHRIRTVERKLSKNSQFTDNMESF